jgi:hypothetical protein
MAASSRHHTAAEGAWKSADWGNTPTLEGSGASLAVLFAVGLAGRLCGGEQPGCGVEGVILLRRVAGSWVVGERLCRGIASRGEARGRNPCAHEAASCERADWRKEGGAGERK